MELLRVLTTTRRNDSGDQFRLMAEAVFETTDQLAPLPGPERKLLRRVRQPKDDKRRIVARYKHGDASVSLARPDGQPLARWTVTLVVCLAHRSVLSLSSLVVSDPLTFLASGPTAEAMRDWGSARQCVAAGI